MNKIKKLIYDEKIEEIINDIFKIQIYLEEDSFVVLERLMDLYDETKYPGIYYYIGEGYYYGNYEFEKDENVGFEYIKKAADAGYYKAIDMLGGIYTSKALEMLDIAKTYYETLALDHDCMYSKLDLGNNLMASYLIDSSGMHYNNYDQFYTGLGLVAESFQMGLSEANLILNVLDKDKKFMEDYKQRILESKHNLIHEIYSVSKDDLISNDEFEDYDEYILDEE